MGDNFDVKFRQRFVVIENNLLALDSSSIGEFNHQWTTLVHDLRVAMDSESLSSSTVETAYSLANRVSSVVQSFLDLEILAEKLMSSLLHESSPTLNRPPPTPPSESPDTSVPSYIKPSYEWLVDNLHNPYPSPEIRDAIARKSGAMRKDVDNWFMDVRKRIGWNDARKTYFSNKRAQIIDAATRFYAHDDKLSLSQGAEHALVSIMEHANNLYRDKFSETILATRLDAAVKDLTPQTKAEAKVQQLRQLQSKEDRDPYPSPEPSPEPTHPLSVMCDREKPASQHITSRKRRSLSIDPVEISQSEDVRPVKRSRSDHSSSSSEDSVAFGLPSPAISLVEPIQTFEPSNPSFPSSLVPLRSSCKRRLSDSDGILASKRPRHLVSAPRTQAVSDPLPPSNNLLFDETSLDGWFQQIFDCDNPVNRRTNLPNVGEISSTGVSIELGNLSDFDLSLEVSRQIFEPPAIKVADVPVSSDVAWNEFDLNDLLTPSDLMPRSSSLNDFGASPHTPLAQDISNLDTSLDELHSSGDFGTLFDFSSPATVGPVAVPYNHVSNEIWDFSASVPTKDGTCELEKHIIDLRSNNGLFSSFDLDGTSFLPSNIEDKVRQGKEKEFRETCEKARKLALELEKDNLFL